MGQAWKKISNTCLRYSLAVKVVLLGISMWLCVVWISLKHQRSKVPLVSAEDVACIMLRWALPVVIIISVIQYCIIIKRSWTTIAANKLMTAGRIIGGFLMCFIMGGAAVSGTIMADRLVTRASGLLSNCVTSWDNLFVAFLALGFLVVDYICKPAIPGAKEVIKLDWAILLSLVIASIFLASFKDHVEPALIIGFNTGMLVFHMMLAALLFGLEEDDACSKANCPLYAASKLS